MKDFEISTLQKISKTLAASEAVSTRDAELWAKYWVAEGVFDN
jgi:hypothetical protein